MTETNAKIHVLADETLGGIKREYVEVDRKAEVGEKIVIVDADVREEKPYSDGDIFDIENSGSSCVRTTCDRYLLNEEYHVLEPTDIVHIDGERYELTDRKAEVGEKVLVVDADVRGEEPYDNGIIFEVRKSYKFTDAVRTVCDRIVARSEYRVLVPVETTEADEPQPADIIDVVSNLATRVADLERTIKRQKDEIDTLHKDNRTLGEELARVKELKGSNESWPAVVSFAEFCENYIAYSKAMKEAQS
ncbi:hypothetical protein [Bacillus mojavensis]|uniref:hypothetical protein n=1 Tax=Bacillus mojavensis TaxID=72360 RepID=UPI002282F0AD|nr:hypothetical protein [Bacillus mojavensis]MCY9090915.1 hypothetical protein [Bacillus mojavensis]